MIHGARGPRALPAPPALTIPHGARGSRALPPRPLSLPPMTQHGAHGAPALPPTTHHGVHGAPPPRLQLKPRPALCGLAAQLLQRTTPTCQLQSRALSHRGLVLLLLTTATTPRGCNRSRRALHQ